MCSSDLLEGCKRAEVGEEEATVDDRRSSRGAKGSKLGLAQVRQAMFASRRT